MWAGLRPSFHQYAFYGAAGLAVFLVAAGPSHPRRAVFRDAVFWLGLLFNAYLVVQWSNSGRELFLDPASNTWMYTEPPRKGWPYAFKTDEAWQMITWFFPAWILTVAMRSPHFTAASSRRLLITLVASAGLLALFGLIQYQSGTKEVYWVTPFSAGFFASFSYKNHATSFFGLMACVSAGVFFWHFFSRGLPTRAGVMVIAVVSMLLCLLGLMFCGSRAAVFFAVALALLFLVYGFTKAWKQFRPIQRLHLSLVTLVVMAALAMSIGGLANDAIIEEFKPKPIKRITGNFDQPGKVHLTLNLDLRLLMAQTGGRVWLSEPWFGVGGWGYANLAAFFIPEDQWWVVKRDGFANVHLDALQFLAEFGIIGFGLLGFILLVMVVNAMRAPPVKEIYLFSGIGLSLVLVHSLIDIPFRSPGVMYHWLAVLALMPKLAEINFPTSYQSNNQL